MVISPEYLEKYVAEDNSRLVSLEKAVDEILFQQVIQGKDYPLCVDREKLGTGLYEKAILNRYRANGWNIEFKADGLNLDWYEFRPKDPQHP